MESRISEKWIVVLPLLIFVLCSSDPLLAQSDFTRNDNYDFRGKHELSLYGTSLDNVNIHIESDSDFRLFKLHAQSRYWIWLGDAYFVTEMRVDMNNDGTWEQGWTTSSEINVSYTYPNPANGISANYTVKVEIHFTDIATDDYYVTRYYQITTLSTPQVYATTENDAFVQLRDEDCTNKIPVLMLEGFDPLDFTPLLRQSFG